MAEKIISIGENLEIWKAHIDELIEQDINARYMTNQMMERLATTIKRDKRLESLPFCALVDDKIEIISGHHRVRAARKAELFDLYVIVDTSGLNRDKIKAKQLAHNSIQGEDNMQLVEQIYKSIQDAGVKLEAFIDESLDYKLEDVSITDISIDLSYKNISIIFSPLEQELFEKVIEKLNQIYDTIYLVEYEQFEKFKEAVGLVGDAYNIRSTSTALSKMVEIAGNYLKIDMPKDEKTALKDLFGVAYIPKESAEIINQAIIKIKKDKKIADKDSWKIMEILAKEYLADVV